MLDEIARILLLAISAETAALLAHHLEIIKILSRLIVLSQGEIWLVI
jgi:hypothetical protein